MSSRQKNGIIIVVVIIIIIIIVIAYSIVAHRPPRVWHGAQRLSISINDAHKETLKLIKSSERGECGLCVTGQ
jgi:hypothetical protein